MRKKIRNQADEIRLERQYIINENSDFYLLEAYKSLRTNVRFSLPNEDQCRVLMLTSSEQGEGKSITAVNLAISFSLDGKKVLVIDCDLRRPKLARLMDEHVEIGLSNLLIQPEIKGKAIRKSKYENLDILLSGDIPPNPSELLGSEQMSSLLNELRGRYDYIIMDTPPLNLVTDAMVLSAKADGTLFVVRAGRAERGAVLRATELLKIANAKMLGFVLNDVEEKTAHYGYKRYGYYKSHGYGGYGYGYSKDANNKTDSKK